MVLKVCEKESAGKTVGGGDCVEVGAVVIGYLVISGFIVMYILIDWECVNLTRGKVLW